MWKPTDAGPTVREPSGGGSGPAPGARAYGRTIAIKGELRASEDLTVDGQVEGKVELPQHLLTIGAGAKLRADVFARSVIVLGAIAGNVTATEKVDLRAGASLEGNISAPKLAIADGAQFQGRIEMTSGSTRSSPPAAQKSDDVVSAGASSGVGPSPSHAKDIH